MVNYDLWRAALTVVVLCFLGGIVVGWVVIICRAIKASRGPSRNMETLLKQTAGALATHPPQQWAGWDVQLLRALDGKVDNGTYREALEMIRDSIATRLDVGKW